MDAMPEFQLTSWRELPSLVVVRDGDQVVKVPLPDRFQEAIDEAAMRLDAADATAYLDGWTRSEWQPVDDSPDVAAPRLVAELETRWTTEAVTAYLDGLG